MKQLEPIFKYHFWILLFLGLIMAFTGWWMATSTMQAAIKDRKGKIETAEKNIPKDEVPSADFESKLKDINARQKHKVDESRTVLYARQKEKMVWPEVIREQASKLKYRGDFDSISPLNFRSTGYPMEVKRVYQIPRPINPLDGSGIVDFPESRMPSKDWGDRKPTSQEMWDEMEDLWLLEPILQAIRAVNGGADSERFDAVVVSIDELKLLGGDRSKIGAKVDATAGGGGFDDGGGGFGNRRGGGGDDRRGDRTGRTAAGAGANGPGLDINAADELGDATSTRVTEDPDAAADLVRGGGSQATERRYVDDDPSQPFRTRGFKLTVTMNHRRLPDFFAELTSTEGSPWPIQILRMHMMQAGAVSGGNSRGGGGGGIGGNAFNNSRGRRDRDDDGRGGGGGGGIFGPNRGGPVATDSTSPGNQATLETAYLAKVTLVGLITLYNEPEALESSGGSTSPTTAATTAAGAADGESEATAATGELAPADDAEAMTASEDDAAAEGQPDGAASEAMPESAADDETQPTPSSEETDENPAKTDDSAATENKE